jgi:hypothetical protein
MLAGCAGVLGIDITSEAAKVNIRSIASAVLPIEFFKSFSSP